MHQHRLGGFALKALGRKARLSEGALDHLDEAAARELRCGDIHGDVDRLSPACRLATGLAQDPLPELDDQPGFFQKRDELRGPDKPTFRVPPADECLQCHHPAGAGLDNRLVMNLELLASERRSQFQLQAPTGSDLLVHLGLEEAEHASTVRFGTRTSSAAMATASFSARA